MEQRFGYDFSRVRVHCGATAERSAQDVNAKVYTFGRNIVFGTGWFAPRTQEGRRLIAHELAHVVQQSISAPLIQKQKGQGTATAAKQKSATTTSQPTDAFKKAGVDSPRHYLDKDAPELLATVLSQSNLLRKYLKRGPRVVGQKFTQYDSDEQFEDAYMRLHKISPGSEKAAKANLSLVRGWYDSKTDTIHLRPRADYGQALHEAIHKLSDPRFRAIFGYNPVDEEVTQYITDRILEEQGLPPAKTLYN